MENSNGILNMEVLEEDFPLQLLGSTLVFQ